jgi:beta-glucosidase
VALASLLAAFCLTAARPAVVGAAQPTSCPWLDRALPIQARVSELTAAMSLEQQVSLMQLQPGAGAYSGYQSFVPPIPTLCIPAITQQDGPAGVDGGTTGVTQLPAPIAAAATFDIGLLRRYGATVGGEMRAKGVDVGLAPTLNLVRVPEWGRSFETLGEDPYLTAALGDADIEGIQSQGVIATAKHYVEYNQETGRLPVAPLDDDIVSLRAMQETELSVFGSAVEHAHVGGIMCAFPLINGTFNCQDQYLLSTVLRDQFGFKGYVRSDNPPPINSDAAAANAGLDQTRSPYFDANSLLADVNNGSISRATIKAAASAILYPMFQMGIFNHPPTGSITASASTPADVAFARAAAEEGTVLLRNDRNTLPLLPLRPRRHKRLRSIAVIGDDANITPRSAGGGSSQVLSDAVVTPLAGIQARAGSRVQVTYTPTPPPGQFQQAVTNARYAQVAIIFVGRFQSEGWDLPNLGLGGEVTDLIRAVSRVNKHTVVVLNTGGPVMMPWLNRAQAVIEAWFPGQEDGNAIAAVLFGDVNPSGKLPVTFPSSASPPLSDGPSRWPGVNGQIHYSEQLRIGYRWYDAYGLTPLFPFGFGLSYTSFAFSGLTVTPIKTTSIDPNRRPDQVVAVVQAHVKNTGDRRGAEVAQLYLGDPRFTGEPVRQLRGFARVELAPKHSATVTFALTARDLAYWRTAANHWAVAHGRYRVYVGDSSALLDLPLRSTLTVG